MIIQGTNEPIVLEFPDDMTDVQDFSAVLIMKYSKVLQKQWRKDDITIDGSVVTLPLMQNDTKNFKNGNAILQVKWKMNDKIYADESDQYIKKWYDSTRL